MIIIDLGGVVFKEPEHFAFEALPLPVRTQFPAHFKPPRIFLRAFDFANLVAGQDLKMQWLMGTVSGNYIAHIIGEQIDNPIHLSFFANEEERILIKHAAPMMFVPSQLAASTYLCPEALEFVQKCTKKGIRLAILSNWDPASFELIQKKYPEFFIHFKPSDMYIPATTGYAKPDKRCYQLILDNLHADPAHCLFIDDSKTNVEAAAQCGIQSILHSDWPTTIAQLSQDANFL